MSQYGVKILAIIGGAFIIATFLFLLTNLGGGITEEEVVDAPQIGQPKDGVIDTYDKTGNLKTRVNYIKGIKHGISYLYYANGTVQLAMPYEHGKREGTSKKYYENGKIYAETPYSDDLLTGTRTLYFRNGKLKAKIPYYKSMVGVGLEEYKLKGGKKMLTEELAYILSTDELRITAPSGCNSDIEFFITDLRKGEFLDEKDGENIRIGAAGAGVASVDLRRFTPSYLMFRDIICKCKTKAGNEYLTKLVTDFN